LARNLLHPGLRFEEALPQIPGWARDAAVWGLVAGLLVRPAAAAAMYLAAAFIGTFFSALYRGSLRHQGLLVVMALCLYWIVLDARRGPGARPGWRNGLFRAVAGAGLGLYLAGSVVSAVRAVDLEWRLGWSASARLAALLRSRPEYASAVVMGEPDYQLDALSYYSANPLYFPRERRYGKYVNFTAENRDTLSLGELLGAAEQVQRSQGRRALIVIGLHPRAPRLAGQLPYSFGKVFRWTEAETQEFQVRTRLVAAFDTAATDEYYKVYELR